MDYGNESNVTVPDHVDDQTGGGSYISSLEIVYICVGVLGFTTNLISALTFKQLRTYLAKCSRLLLIHQSSVDCAWSICLTLRMVSPPRSSYTTLSSSTLTHLLLCKLWSNNNVFWFLAVLSTYSLLSLSLYHYLAIVHPHLYYTGNEKYPKTREKIVKALIASAWMISLSYAVYPAVMFDIGGGRCFLVDIVGAGYFSYINISLKLFIPFLSLCYLYLRMITHYNHYTNAVLNYDTQSSVNTTRSTLPASAIPSHVHRQQCESRSVTFAVGENKPNRSGKSCARDERRSKHIKKSLFILCCLRAGAYIVCFTPNQIFYFLLIAKAIPYNLTGTDIHTLTIVLLYLYCFLNPIIYTISLKPFRLTLKEKIYNFFEDSRTLQI